MAERLKRASFARIAVGMAALAFPLFAVGTAQAAIGGAPAEVTSAAPDLVSATAIDSTDVDYCFDKTINNSGFAGAAGDYTLTGYRSGRTVTATSAALEISFGTPNQCVRASFSSSIGDIGQYTVARVAALSVETPQLNFNQLPDSTTLTVPASLSPTHNGTTGFTVGPDLQSVSTDATTNTVTYLFDQNVVTNGAGGGAPFGPDFYLETPGALTCMGTAAAGSGDSVTVVFAPTCNVQVASKAGVIPGAVFAKADPTRPNAPETVTVPGQSAVSSAPDLTSAVLSTDGSGINFTFDKLVTPINPAAFEAVLSTTGVVEGTSFSVIASSSTSTTIHVVFPNLSRYNEYVVYGAVTPGAVADSSLLSNINLFDGQPAGDNAGAFARGFTTGPDATSAIGNLTTGQVSINLDQRAFSYTPFDIELVDNLGGLPIATAPTTAVSLPTQAAGPQTVTAQFSPAQLVAGKNLYIAAGALAGSASPTVGTGGDAQSSVDQILSITSTSTLLREAKLARKQHVSKREIKTHRAMVRKQEKRLLSKLSHTIHHKL